MNNKIKLLLLLATLTAGCKTTDRPNSADPGTTSDGPETLLFSMNSLAGVSDNPPVRTIFTNLRASADSR